MDIVKRKYTPWQLLKHRYQSRRDIPFRKKFFVGYDLTGNTYWEFTVDGNMQRLRRKLEPYEPKLFKADYFSTIPTQWLQWLRRTKEKPPTLEELLNDQYRQERIKILAQQADEKWTLEKSRLQMEQDLKLQIELERSQSSNGKIQDKADTEHISAPSNSEVDPATPVDGEREYSDAADVPEGSNKDPWADADNSKEGDPIVTANIKPKK